MERVVEVVVGTYEELILGYRLSLDNSNHEFVPTFTNHSHTGCIKHMAISSKGILASGGTDETIWLFNLRKKQEIGSLVHHSGTVTCLSFHEGSHLFSTSEDAKLCLWKSHSWECLRTFKGHKGAITSVAVHPSGKMALTVGRDRSLHTWNLVRGRPAYVTNIKQAADIVAWSPDGTQYLIVFNNRIDIYKVETATVFHTVSATRRINAAFFLQNNMVVYGGEGGDIVFYNVLLEKEVHCINTNSVRIRGLVFVNTTDEDCPFILLSASSDGVINAYKLLFSKNTVQTELIASHNTKFRLTCIAAMEIQILKKEIKEEIDIKEDMKIEVDSEEEIKTEPESDSAPEFKSGKEISGHEELEPEADVKIEPESEDSASEEKLSGKVSKEKVADVDSGHVEDSDSDESESCEEERPRKRSRSSVYIKRSKKAKFSLRPEKEKTGKTKKIVKESKASKDKKSKRKQKGTKMHPGKNG